MEPMLPPVPFQLIRDPNSGQFLFFPTPTAATSIGMFIAPFSIQVDLIKLNSNAKFHDSKMSVDYEIDDHFLLVFLINHFYISI